MWKMFIKKSRYIKYIPFNKYITLKFFICDSHIKHENVNICLNYI